MKILSFHYALSFSFAGFLNRSNPDRPFAYYDLTRDAIAQASGCQLELVKDVLEHIRQLFSSRGREMPPANSVQAKFPVGSNSGSED